MIAADGTLTDWWAYVVAPLVDGAAAIVSTQLAFRRATF